MAGTAKINAPISASLSRCQGNMKKAPPVKAGLSSRLLSRSRTVSTRLILPTPSRMQMVMVSQIWRNFWQVQIQTILPPDQGQRPCLGLIYYCSMTEDGAEENLCKVTRLLVLPTVWFVHRMNPGRGWLRGGASVQGNSWPPLGVFRRNSYVRFWLLTDIDGPVWSVR